MLNILKRFLCLRKMQGNFKGSENLKFTPISKIGFGTYRLSSRIPTHKSSLIYALENGIRLIDTASNYTDGESEELIGEVLMELISNKTLTRNDVQIISKFGYFCFNNQTRLFTSQQAYPELVELNPHLVHCIHPEFIKDQLSQSLSRLKTDYIDCYLLHNPEYYLIKNIPKFGCGDNESLIAFRNELLRRISQSFEFLENEINTSGNIKCYGISSNSFSIPSCDPHFLPYEELIARAEQAAKNVGSSHHHFRIMQFPANLIETESFENALKWCKNNGLTSIINRPLNAFSEKGSWRLADYPNTMTNFLSYSKSLKQEYLDLKYHRVVETLQEAEKCILGQFGMALFEWESYLEGHILPTTRKAALEDKMDECHKSFEKLQAWLDLLNSVGKHKSGLHTREFLNNKMQYNIPEDQKLQNFALEYVLNKPGVSCVLLGARNKDYIEDALNFR